MLKKPGVKITWEEACFLADKIMEKAEKRREEYFEEEAKRNAFLNEEN